MKENTLSYTTRIGKTTFIVNVKQSESAKKPLNTVFQEICRHEMLGDFSADKYLNLENLQKSSWQTRSRGNRIPGKDKVCQVLQSARADFTFQGKCRYSDTGYAKTACTGSRV